MRPIIVLSLIFVLLTNPVLATLEAKTLPQSITLDPEVKHVIVVPKEYNFDEERAEFNEFRARYATFWIFFYLTAFIMPYVW